MCVFFYNGCGNITTPIIGSTEALVIYDTNDVTDVIIIDNVSGSVDNVPLYPL